MNLSESALADRLHDILEHARLVPWFQPIVALREGKIFGYESVIRGPAGSPLHLPTPLFQVARECGRLADLDLLCQEAAIRQFARLGLPGCLFLNVDPAVVLEDDSRRLRIQHTALREGLAPGQVVVEFTEHTSVEDYEAIQQAAQGYRDLGFAVALDDVGAGYSGLRLWSEVKPEYAKIDMHFVQGLHGDQTKRHFVRFLQEMALSLGCRTVAEGIEAEDDAVAVETLGVSLGQGYYFARPLAEPSTCLAQGRTVPRDSRPRRGRPMRRSETVATLLQVVPFVGPEARVSDVATMFEKAPGLWSLPVVQDGRPVGVVRRHSFQNVCASAFGRDLYRKKPIEVLMDRAPLIAEQDIPVEELGQHVTQRANVKGWEDFVVTEQGAYVGMGTMMDLLRKITELQIRNAHHANPLTLLPGTVPADEHIELLLAEGRPFTACYVDLDNFKPFNDTYGYNRGDDVIRFLARLLVEASDPDEDFVAHIGGDDFLVIFERNDWQSSCQAVLDAFRAQAVGFYSPEDRAAGGIRAKDRSGNEVFFPVLTVSVGAVPFKAGWLLTHRDVAALAAEAKAQAKKMEGNALFVERRSYLVPKRPGPGNA